MTEGRAIEVAAELQAQGLQAVRAERSNSYRSWVVRLNGGAAASARSYSRAPRGRMTTRAKHRLRAVSRRRGGRRLKSSHTTGRTTR